MDSVMMDRFQKSRRTTTAYFFETIANYRTVRSMKLFYQES